MIEIHRLDTFNNEIIMQMTDGGSVLCTAKAVDRCDGTAEIISIDQNSFDMGKALLNAIDLMGIKKVVCADGNMDALLKSLRFSKEGEKYVLDLNGYFDAGCGSQKQEG